MGKSRNLIKMKHKIICGKSEIELKQFDDNSFDSCVTDPPYELGFMGKTWDRSGIAFDTELWQELFRVMKPGAHILVAGIARTHHRMWVALEDAGFNIKDGVYHIFGSGFPKSVDISKQLDKIAGVKREVVGKRTSPYTPTGRNDSSDYGDYNQPTNEKGYLEYDITKPATEAAKQFEGFGSALKPAVEIWCLAQKSISERNIASNVLKCGVGGINIDGTRILAPEGLIKGGCTKFGGVFGSGNKVTNVNGHPQGRFPSNLILSCDCKEDELVEGKANSSGGGMHGADKFGHSWITEPIKNVGYGNEKYLIHKNPNCVCAMLDEQSGELNRTSLRNYTYENRGGWKQTSKMKHLIDYGDKGGCSRFFYQAKASQKERWFYCTICKQAYPMKLKDAHIHNAPKSEKYKYLEFHPTQKPLQLIQYLVRLITPPDGTVLDPFMGTGTTLVAAEKEGVNSIGIDSILEYCEIAETRLREELIQLKLSGGSTIEKEGYK